MNFPHWKAAKTSNDCDLSQALKTLLRCVNLLYGDSVCWTACDKPLPGYRWNAWISLNMCASFDSQAGSTESTWHKFGHQARNFIHTNGWVNLLALVAMIAISRPKWSCSSAKIIRASSPSKVMKYLAQTDFCSYESYLHDASSCTEITIINTIQMEHVQVRCLQIFVPAMLSC